jgi:glycerol-3-phosphate acyltransferase PlsY
MDILLRIICLVIGYVLGCIQTSYIIGRIKGIDLRNYGSGNLGATNALRVMGKKLGLITFACDILKAVAAFMIAKYALSQGDLGGLYAGFGVVVGHNWPFYLKFRGGKGIAVTFGLMLCIEPWISLIVLIIAIAVIALTKYVSLGSILAMLSMALIAVVKYYSEPEMMILLLLISLIAIVKHRSNIKRLLAGTENKLGAKKIESKEENK